MKKVFLLIITILLSSCSSQKNTRIKTNTEYNFSEIVKQFDTKKLNYIGLKKNCSGGVLKELDKNDCGNCYPKNSIYIFWAENEKSYVQKYDNCSAFNIIEILDFNPNTYLKKNTLKLQTEKIGKYQINKNGHRTISHSCFRKFIINDGKTKYENEYDISDLTGKKINLNYKDNNNLQLVKLEETLTKIIKGLAKENQFKRNKKTCYNK